MRYYLDTNIVYKLKSLSADIIGVSYTSILTILEILAGIDKQSYYRRRAALKGMEERRLAVDLRTPDMIIFESFDTYREFSMIDPLVSAIKEATQKCISTPKFEDYINNTISNKNILDYFSEIDSSLTAKFNNSFSSLINVIKPSELSRTFKLGELSVKVDFSETIKASFINDDNLSMLVRVLATGCHNQIASSPAVDKPKFHIDDVISSYNGGLNFFICGWLAYEQKNIGIAHLPGRNDYQDLLHLIYLRNYLDRKIISDDHIYSELAPQYWISMKAMVG